ncbi:sodium-independent anion transporter [Devosia sp. A449]
MSARRSWSFFIVPRTHSAIVGQVPGTEYFRNVKRHQVETVPGVLSIRIYESLYIANARYLEDLLTDQVAANPGLSDVVLMCSAVNAINMSALESLEAIENRLNDPSVRLQRPGHGQAEGHRVSRQSVRARLY